MSSATEPARMPATLAPSQRYRLFAVLGGLYLAQAIPSYLFVAALPPIMRELGVSRTAIGAMSILLLPLVLKFIWAPWVDRIRPFARAHRAGWVFITQSLTILAILALIMVGPTEVNAIIAIGFVASLLISTQDIATDGYAAKYLPEEDRAIGNAIQGGSVAFGVVIGGTLGLVLYHHIGWTGMLVTIAAISLLPLIAAAMMREDDPVLGIAPAPRPSIRAFLKRPEARQILWIALTYRASEGLVKAMEGSYLVDAGIPLDQIGYLSGLSATTAGLAGSAIAAWMVKRQGLPFVLALLGGMRTICFALFAAHALGAVVGVWPLFGAAGFQTLIRYMEIVALYSLFMAVTTSDQPGTDFTILACAQLLVYLAGSMLAGKLADAMGYGFLFSLATAISAIAVIATVRMLAQAKIMQPPGAGAIKIG
ncbi:MULTISPECIES: MFS transporter [Bosea]|uniref:MFS transporter n=1 Tax=Bosea TaxID=85413 RepID=UPI00214FC34F|nr:MULTISPECIES: MFS transporter [Bosea]MCR4520520.1 MFS transporter [Bosea sp. 47.2.35]MDR6827874.1 PAT family beta-lactamase induction signal transducer AmpG [Bosea robiniae]MDR6894432.1 PAT family beta-lactamase induction signal transducer AmpG [Bosea sp. BE109]MDR7137980.1 PAT family beta-lactamase induction signal transducer AmpG [Bosea sp. BE168]MDR7174679.1 PAT family beta-lactamase induction signal transducer AmpG [Bosea sp. BE271]